MATYKDNTTASWQKFLTPLVTALIALCGAGAMYIKSLDTTKETEDKVIERIIKVETRVENQDFRLVKLERDADILKATLSDMKSDLSFIRGKMETKGDK